VAIRTKKKNNNNATSKGSAKIVAKPSLSLHTKVNSHERDEASSFSEDGDVQQVLRTSLAITKPPSARGYAGLRVQYLVDVMLLAELTDPILGRAACNLLEERPLVLPIIIRNAPTSFLSHLPARVGATPCLDISIECVMARLTQLLGGSVAPGTIRKLYGDALRSVAVALATDEGRQSTDVLCAMQLLAMWEVCAAVSTRI